MGTPSAVAASVTDALSRRSAALAATGIGLYVHVPFCVHRCGYCAFDTVALGEAGGEPALDRWAAAARAEVLDAADRLVGARPLISVYFGGGTPTLAGADRLARLIGEVRRGIELRDDVEITLEANPDTVTRSDLDTLVAAGVNRMSFGLQSTSAGVLGVLERSHDPGRAIEVVAEARAAGIESLSLDLIYGTPGETDAEWRRSVEAALGAGVDHLSAYALSIEDGTRLAARVRRGDLPPPSPDAAADRYEVLDDLAGAAGLEWYEISNWARPGARCAHNLLYWRNENWWGLGPGAHSHVAGLRWWNERSLPRWTGRVLSGAPPWAGHEEVDPDGRALEDLMLGIRTAEGVELGGLDVAAVGSVVVDGLGVRRDDHLVLTRRGRLLADEVVRRLACSGSVPCASR